MEENILVKAKQKQHLDFLVMTEGNFSEQSLFTASSVKDMLGISTVLDGNQSEGIMEAGPENIEAAMAAAEDDEDVSAMKGAKDELRKEEEEFDESGIPSASAPTVMNDADDAIDMNEDEPQNETAVSTELTVPIPVSTEEALIEAEFQNWQKKVGNDFNAIENALKPIERYAYNFNTVVEPFYSLHYLLDQQRMNELALESGSLQHNEDWNVAEIEKQKEEEEINALEGGELIWAPVSVLDIKKLKRWYIRESAHRKRETRRRLLTGEAWSEVIDPITQFPFWYNEDTGDASYEVPAIVVQQQKNERARERGFSALPGDILLGVMRMLTPRERMKSAEVCAHWRLVASDEIFNLKVLPVEAVDSTRISPQSHTINNKMLSSMYFPSLSAAIAAAVPGDTVELCVGHFWVDSVDISIPLRFVGCMQEPSKCSVEVSGQICVTLGVSSVIFSGITFSRPRKIPHVKALIKAVGSVVNVRFVVLYSAI